MTPTIQISNAKIKIDNAVLQHEAVQTSFLSEQGVAGDAQIFLPNYDGFVDGQILLIGDIGDETAEIAIVNGSPSVDDGVPLTSVLTLGHAQGVNVTVIDFNQIELSHATTATGSKTLLTTTLGSGLVAVQPDTKNQIYNESEFTSGYYFARYKNSGTGVFSSYTDPLVYSGWDANTVGFMIDAALADADEEISSKVTKQDCYNWLNKFLTLVQGKLKRWPEFYAYNAIIGQTVRGENVIVVPTDAYDKNTNKSIIALRVGSGNNLDYLSPGEFQEKLNDVVKNQVRTQALAGDTTLEVDNSYDFADSGSVDIYISGVKYTITYTGVTRSSTAGVLTGVPASGTGSITVTIPVDTYIWQGMTEGTPEWFTVRNGNIEYWPTSSTYNENVYSDYSKVATAVDSDGDTIDSQRYDMAQAYLTWRIKMKARNNGTLDMDDGFYLTYKEILNDAIRTLPSNNLFKIRPSLNRIGNIRQFRRR